VFQDENSGPEYRRPCPEACMRSTSVHTAALTANGPVNKSSKGGERFRKEVGKERGANERGTRLFFQYFSIFKGFVFFTYATKGFSEFLAWFCLPRLN